MSWTAAGAVVAQVRADGDGVGVHALRPLPKGTLIGVFHGELAAFEIGANGQPDYRGEDEHMMLDLGVHRGMLFAMVLRDGGSLVNRINHSCQPNCELNGVHGLCLYTARDIAQGEELTFDYRPITLKPLGVRCWCAGVPEASRCVL